MWENSVLAALFDQTVTVYHPVFQPEFTCTRQILKGVSYQWSRTSTLDSLGKSRTGRALMGESLGGAGELRVVCKNLAWKEPPAQPGEGEFTLEIGDKVIPGEGPEIKTREEWAKLVPSLTPGLMVLRQITPYQVGKKVLLVEGKGE